MNISYKDHVTNEEVRRKTQAAIGQDDKLLTTVEITKGGLAMSHGLLVKQRQFYGEETVNEKRRRRIGKTISKNGYGWTLPAPRAAEDMTRWNRVAAKSSVVPKRPCKFMKNTTLD